MREAGPSWTLRALASVDRERLALLERRCNPRPWRPEDLAPFAPSSSPPPQAGVWRSGLGLYGAAEAGGEALGGYVLAQGCGDEAEILVLGVDPALRRRGGATWMLRKALAGWASQGVRRVHLEVRAGNAPAQALYARVGFAPSGRRPRYYADNGEDALLWTCALSAIPGGAGS